MAPCPTHTMRLVLDTHVWMDLLMFEQPRLLLLGQALEAGGMQVLATEPMLEEFAHVIARPVFKLDPERVGLLCAKQRERVTLQRVAPDCRLPCTDRDDQMFIDLAVAARVDWLMSRDRALLRLRKAAGRRHALRIGSPEDWLAAHANAVPIMADRLQPPP